MTEEKSQAKKADTNEGYFANSDYMRWIHKVGRISTLISLAGLISVPLFSAWITGISINFDDLALALASLTAFIVLGGVEPFSYAPILGASGTYIGFITGRINVCFGPIVANLDKLNAEPNSKEHEIISSIVTGVMSLTGLVLMTLAMIFLGFFSSFLSNPILQPGYDNMVFAMIGAFSVPMIMRTPKLAIAPATFMLILSVLLSSSVVLRQQSIILPLMLLFILPVNYFLYKRGLFEEK
ncbi:hypothetical protein ACQV2T_01715 [Facklamia sp. P13069]|uniref:hypothetical protein n=1 Tax=Facklamia sp. P13069 TaxID=3421954 RepID=UPI003D176BA1